MANLELPSVADFITGVCEDKYGKSAKTILYHFSMQMDAAERTLPKSEYMQNKKECKSKFLANSLAGESLRSLPQEEYTTAYSCVVATSEPLPTELFYNALARAWEKGEVRNYEHFLVSHPAVRHRRSRPQHPGNG